MNHVLLGVAMALLVSCGMLLVRALRGPEVYDRILAVNSIGTKTVVLVVVIAFIGFPEPDSRVHPDFFVDTAIVYALVNFISTIGILKFIQYRRLG